ncbi:hypothetical protein Tco_0732573 [Tanacetum coccineum]
MIKKLNTGLHKALFIAEVLGLQLVLLCRDNLNHRNALGMERDCQHGLYTAGGVGSRVDEMILARERSGFAGEKVWGDIPVVTGFWGGKDGFRASEKLFSSKPVPLGFPRVPCVLDRLQVVVLFALAWMDFHELELMGDLLSIGIRNLEKGLVVVSCGTGNYQGGREDYVDTRKAPSLKNSSYKGPKEINYWCDGICVLLKENHIL